MKKRLLSVIALLIAAALALGPGSSASAAENQTAEDTLIYASACGGGTFDPCDAVSDWTTVILMIYEPLIAYDSESRELVGVLADAWEVTDDSTITFHVRKDVIFSNGDPATAEDVIFSWQRCRDCDALADYAAAIDWDSCTASGQDLTIKLTQPNAEFIYVFCGAAWAVVDKIYAEELGEDAFRMEPVGTGPYVLENYIQGESVTLVPNLHYWGGSPRYGTVVIHSVPDEADRIAAFEAGEYDIARITSADAAASLAGRESEGILLSSAPGGTFYYVDFWDRGDIFSSAQARLAFAHAVDWQAMAESLWGDYAAVPESDLPTVSPDWLSVGAYAYDPDLAREYLAEAGYPDGFDIGIAVGSTGCGGAMAEFMQPYLAEVGIDLTIDVMDDEPALEASSDGSHEIAIVRGPADVPAGALIWSGRLDGSDSLLHGVSGGLPAGEAFRELCARFLPETDPEARILLAQEIQQLVHDECLWCPIAQVDNIWVHRDTVEEAPAMILRAGFSSGPDIRGLFF